MTIHIDQFSLRSVLSFVVLLCATAGVLHGPFQYGSAAEQVQTPASEASGHVTRAPTFDQLKADGARLSNYLKHVDRTDGAVAPEPDLLGFRRDIAPVLNEACSHCHDPDSQEGNIRIDTLDPDLFRGTDVDWWIEVLAVLANGEMPPPDESDLGDEDRGRVIAWLSSEIQRASVARRAERGHSSFRRMTRYEYNYALQDLLGLPFDFAKDLPPESNSEDGFQNSSEMLHMSAIQLATYRESALNALDLATVSGDRPELMHWGVSMEQAARDTWTRQDEELQKIRDKHKDNPEKLQQELDRQTARFREKPNQTYYKNLKTGRAGRASWRYVGAKYAWEPTSERPTVLNEFDHVAIIPPRQKLIIELGDRIPEKGTLRVRVRAGHVSANANHIPSLQLEFGWQASNDSAAAVTISQVDLLVDAPADRPQFYQWDIPLSEIYPRNTVRKISKMGDLPSPSELIKLVNSSVSQGDIQVDYVEVTAPIYEQWPPASHNRIFIESDNRDDESTYAREVLSRFMTRAWRRQATPAEISQKVALFESVRPSCNDFRSAMIEVLATVISSPKFLYLVRADSEASRTEHLSSDELASRLSIFLWSSIPDEELLNLAATDRLQDSAVLAKQVVRMVDDPRSRRFSKHFVRQWLGMQLLDFLDVDRKRYRDFDQALKEAMQEEPIAFFHEILQNDHSLLDFLHADYTMANERLAQHYEVGEVYGNHFRRIKLGTQGRRGGLLTQAGLLAMNSDGKDSHPLKRGIWMLERLLNDPPPPPPPAVPEIDLTDPEIAKLTLKERIEDHRNDVACMSCHAKIDPWGIAFENFDAVGRWRTEVQGKPVDATSRLFNGQKLEGIDGLKRFLLKNRQDQFVRAMVHKMTTYAIGRPLAFGDRSDVDLITSQVRKKGDGLATMVQQIVVSDLFRTS